MTEDPARWETLLTWIEEQISDPLMDEVRLTEEAFGEPIDPGAFLLGALAFCFGMRDDQSLVGMLETPVLRKHLLEFVRRVRDDYIKES